jgi:hypothetical protein
MAKRFTLTCGASSNSSPYLARNYRTTNPTSSKEYDRLVKRPENRRELEGVTSLKGK